MLHLWYVYFKSFTRFYSVVEYMHYFTLDFFTCFAQVVIGCEGLWGTFLTLTVVYPLSYYLPGNDGGHFENPFDAIVMVQNSRTLQMLVCVFVLFVTIYNCAAVYVTKYLSAIWHAILDNFRPITIWYVLLYLFTFSIT